MPHDARSIALSLGKRGLRVFRLSTATCRPLKKGWTDSADCDETYIHREFSDALGASVWDNIGVATGRGLVVIDVDKKAGPHAFENMERMKRMGMLPPTFTVLTPSGGFHFYYRTKPDVFIRNATHMGAKFGLEGPLSPQGKTLTGIDVRGHHGYVVAPGSIKSDVLYSLERDFASVH